ncbi:MAG: hypothetical protein V4654_08390 [Bdellovibrionota bacterium]
MKTLLASAVFAFSTIATAATYELPKKSTNLSLLTEGKVSVVTHMPNCPKTAMCEPTAILKIQFTLNGCMDTLGPVTINQVGYTADGKMKFVVTAYNTANEASTYTKCFRAPIGVATQVIGMGLFSQDSVEVEFSKAFVRTETL